MGCRPDRIPDVRHPNKVGRWPGRISDVRHLDKVGRWPGRIPDVRHPDKVERWPGRIPNVRHPGGMNDVFRPSGMSYTTRRKGDRLRAQEREGHVAFFKEDPTSR